MIEVTCAIIEHEGKVLAAQRSEAMSLPLKWEFPGGKLHANELEVDCIKREIKEELNMEIDVVADLPRSTHSYGEKVIVLIPFICTYKQGEVRLLEHKQIKWLTLEELHGLDWAEADLPVLANYLKARNDRGNL